VDPTVAADEPSRPPSPRPRRWHRVALGVLLIVAAVVGAVAVAPSVLVPFLAQRLSAATGADVRVAWISWNPLRGRVDLHRLAIAPRPGEPAVMTLRALTVDVALRRWLRGERVLDAIVLRRPWIALRRTGPGDFNVASLFPTLAADAATPSPSAAAGPPTPFRIGLLRIVSGSVEFRDETIDPALETSLHLDDASARDLVFANDGSAGMAFHVESRLEDEPLTLDVDYDTAGDGSHLVAKLEATNASLARALLYVPLGWQRTEGTMDVAVTYERRFEKNALRQHGLKAALTLHDLALTEPWASEPMLRAKRVRVPALAIDLVQQRTDLGTVMVDDFQALVLRDAEGVHVPLATGSPEAEPSTWQTTLDRVALGKGVATLRRVLTEAGPDLTIPLTGGTVRLPPNEVTFDFAGTVAGGRITLTGRAREAATTLAFALDDLGLTEAARLAALPLGFTKGRLSGTVDLTLGPSPPTIRATLTSRDASTAPSRAHPEEVMAWQTLEIEIRESPLDPLRLRVANATVTWPYVMLHRRSDGFFPLTTTGSDGTPVSATPNGDDAWLRCDRITVAGGRLEFWDSTLPKPYGIDLTDLAGSAEGVRVAPMSAERIALTGALDELSPLDLSGTIDPAVTTLRIDVDRLLLPPLNPYIAPALGYEVKSGLARIGSNVRVTGTKIVADTDLVLSRFAMRQAGTDTVEQRIGTPLSVALALMKDTRGDIHLDLPIEGDVGANEYRVGSLLREALGTALLGTLRAPLGFLRGLFRRDQGEQFDLRPVPFPTGSAALGPDGEARIAEIARLLGRQTALAVVLIPEPSRADLEHVRSTGTADPLGVLADLAQQRATAVMTSLTTTHGIDVGRVRIERWEPAEPRIEGDPGVDVQLRTS
jgi:hypothetical protein